MYKIDRRGGGGQKAYTRKLPWVYLTLNQLIYLYSIFKEAEGVDILDNIFIFNI